MPEPVLCYIEGPWAYFTTQPLEKQWGDDWNDAPYEHNAGTPHEQGLVGEGTWTITRVAFDGPWLTPAELAIGPNSRYSVQMINRGITPWLEDCREYPHNPKVVIDAGTPLHRFTSLIQLIGGHVYLRTTAAKIPPYKDAWNPNPPGGRI